MDEPLNRMNKPGRKPEGSFDIKPAPPIALPRRVTPCVCPRCGRAQSPRVRKTYPDKDYADVVCGSCGSNLHFIYATDVNPIPRIRYCNP